MHIRTVGHALDAISGGVVDVEESLMGGQATVFVHVEIVHPDPDAAARFMEETMGARRVERRLSSYIEKLGEGLRIVHVQAGGVVFQIIRPVPIPGLNSWYEHLQEHGPGVHNVTLMMDGLESVRESMLLRGCSVAAEMDLNFGEAGLDVTGSRKVYVVDAIEQAGVRFEMLESLPEWTPGEAP